MSGVRVIAAAFAACLACSAAFADVIARDQPPAGTVIARKVGEEVRFFDVSRWRDVDVRQDLLAGDVLRTNAQGHLAILFEDRTQVRMGRNSTLVVKKIGGDSTDSTLGLESGTIWARAERGGDGLTVETPAAAAAIRGTDWTMTVDGDKTSIIVLEGLVEFSNEHGSLRVAGGEAAVATIGQAPSKVVIVNPDDREQMLFYLSLRNSFSWMPASPLSSPDMRRERARIGAKPPGTRSAEDWLTLAEASLNYDGRKVSLEAARQARRFRLTPGQRARLDLLDALAAGGDHDFAAAAKLFARAAPRLDPRRRAIAVYGGYYSRSLADPERSEPPPPPQPGPYGAMAEAWTVGFLKDIPAAIDILKRAEARYPDDPTLPAARAQLALLVDDRAQVREAIARSLSLDPDDPMALEARANYRADVEGNLDAALGDISTAAEIAPGSTTIWNTLGNIQHTRGATLEAEAALKRSIELDPNDPVGYANLAFLYLDQDRVREAKPLIDRALELDPAFDVGLVARGRYYLQTGEMDKAMQDLLAGSTANPSYAQGLLLLAAGHYESGDRGPAAQALENADRLDPNDPVISSFETAIAIDDYDSDRAIASAQATLRRSRARGGDFAPLSANTDAGSTLNEAFRLQGLNAWGRYYSDSTFDAFSGAAHVDQAVAGSVNPFANANSYGGDPVAPTTNPAGFSALFQGLMFSPEMISGRSRSANLIRRPFLEGAVGGGFTNAGDKWGYLGEVELQGYFAAPIPWSFYVDGKARRVDENRAFSAPGAEIPYSSADIRFEDLSGTAWVTARPTPADRVVVYGDIQRPGETYANGITFINSPQFAFDALAYGRDVDVRSATGGIGWSHTFGYHNVANAALFVSEVKQSSNEYATVFVAPQPIGFQMQQMRTTQRYVQGALNHTIEAKNVVWRYGIEAGALDLTQDSVSGTLIPDLGINDVTRDGSDASVSFGQAYVDASYEFAPGLRGEAALFGNFISGSLDVTRLEPRIGLEWAPTQRQSLRVGYLRETSLAATTTLAPIGVSGLQSNQMPLDIGGYADTIAARWDAEWTDRFFTSVDYQHQQLHDLSIRIPGSIQNIALSDGRLDRVAVSGNVWLGHGFGLFGTVAWADSENEDPTNAGFGDSLPFLPELGAQAGVTWVNPANVKVTLAATYVGERASQAAGVRLPDYWSADAFLTWEPLDKRFELQLAGYNLLGEDFMVAANTPGWGRTFTGSLKVRF
ncbi:MAG: FecR domain-containing protein [Rhizobiales bacterium]|nr:FecR domain-containing protein [Hyphomicrobiales bacterium]